MLYLKCSWGPETPKKWGGGGAGAGETFLSFCSLKKLFFEKCSWCPETHFFLGWGLARAGSENDTLLPLTITMTPWRSKVIVRHLGGGSSKTKNKKKSDKTMGWGMPKYRKHSSLTFRLMKNALPNKMSDVPFISSCDSSTIL